MKQQSLCLISILFFIFIINISFSSEKIYGIPKVIDGDTIKIDNFKIRLFGIDAPEIDQICQKPWISINFFSLNKNYKCGEVSSYKLKNYLKDDSIYCQIKGKDRYRRYLGICYKNKSDINKWMVTNGFAFSYVKYSKKYLIYENLAKKNSKGLWKGKFDKPWEWRKKSK